MLDTKDENLPLKDWFNPVRMIDHLETVYGCGIRLCKVCSLNSPGQVKSMPFELIDRHNQRLNQWNLDHPNNQKNVEYWFRGEPGYYEDDKGRGISDVVLNVLQYETLRIILPTHGFLIGEKKAEQEFRKLAKIAEEYPGRFGILFTIDPWGWYGVDDKTHLASVALSLDAMYYDGLHLKVLYNRDEYDPSKRGSHSSAEKLLKNVIQRVGRLPRQFYPHNAFLDEAYSSGRAAKMKGTRLPEGPDWFRQKYKDKYFVDTDGYICSLETWKKVGLYSELKF